jgi:hypothetical protein
MNPLIVLVPVLCIWLHARRVAIAEERWSRLLRQIFVRAKWKICRLWVIHGPARGAVDNPPSERQTGSATRLRLFSFNAEGARRVSDALGVFCGPIKKPTA